MSSSDMLPPGFRDKMFGSILIATWINSLLLMFEIMQAFRYFSNYAKHDSAMNSWTVGFVVLLEVIAIVSQYACVYLFTVTFWGDPLIPLRDTWPFATVVFCSGMVAMAVQTYLIRRYYTLSRNRIISIGLAILTLLAFVGALYDFGILVSLDKMVDVQQTSFNTPTTIWLATTAIADWGVAIALVYQLQNMKNSFKNTKRLIRRLSVNAIQSGSLSSTVATLVLVAFFLEDTNIITALCFVLSRMYSITLLFNVNYRRSATTIADDSTELSESNRAQFTSVLLEPGSSIVTTSMNSSRASTLEACIPDRRSAQGV